MPDKFDLEERLMDFAVRSIRVMGHIFAASIRTAQNNRKPAK